MSQVIDALARERASAILRTNDQTTAAAAMSAAIRGGFTIVEFTLTVPGVFELIRDFSRRGDVIVGAGTVLEPAEAERAVEAGARFLVSPVVDLEVIAAARSLGVPMMPGTHTPTEMLTAWRAGAELQKLFPAPGLGPVYVRSCLGPLPFLRIVPTNGVDETNAAAWLEAGSFAVGFTTSLFDPAELAAGRFDEVEARARKLLAKVRKEEAAVLQGS